jgi:hypothetical protein
MGNAYRYLFGEPDWKRPLDTEDIIGIYVRELELEGVHFIHVAQERDN